MAPLGLKEQKLCCPNCHYELFDLETPYVNHGVTVTEVSVHTARGEVLIPPMLRMAFVVLLEAYPRAVRYRSLIAAYEEFPSTRDTDDPLNSLRARLAGVRKPLAEIGITVIPTWGYGYRMEIAI